MKNEIEAARAQTQNVYERQARYWDKIRTRTLYEAVWLDQFIQKLKPNGRVLDLGCGSGDPVGQYFMEAGFELLGIDYSETMIAMARQRYPQAHWLVQDMRALDIQTAFDGIYSWDGFLHLSIAEQRRILPKLAGCVNAGGALLLTVGTGEGEVLGTVGGEAVYHASLSPDEYRNVLKDNGFKDVTYVAEDPNCYGRSVVLASGKMD